MNIDIVPLFMKSLKVCFVVPGFYPLLNPSVPGLIGGSESRALMFARGLAHMDGYAISAIAFDYGQPKTEIYDGITVYRDDFGCLRERVSGIRPRLLDVARVIRHRMRITAPHPPLAVREADAWASAGADIYCTFGAADFSAKLLSWCRSVGRPMILFAGSDLDFSAEYCPDSKEKNVYGSRADLCHYAVANARTIVVQTRTQARLLAERFGREGVHIANPINLNGVSNPEAGRARRVVLWVGKSDAVKRPDLVVHLARTCPEVPFKMVLNRADPAIFSRVINAHPPNLEIIERVAPEEIGTLFHEAFALLNTSIFEGFPNTFLEAGKYAVPVLSLEVDPDDVIVRHNAGVVAGGDMARLAEGLCRFHADPVAAGRAGENLHHYVRRHHTLPDRIAELDQLLRGLIADSSRG